MIREAKRAGRAHDTGLLARPRPTLRRDSAEVLDEEIAELQDYLTRLQSEMTGTKLRLSELRVERRFGNRDVIR